MRDLLYEHIVLSWEDVVECERQVHDGLIDVYHQKRFISSLHNVIEISFKQFMINQNDKSVIEIKTKKNLKGFIEKIKEKRKLQSTENLNDYLCSLSEEEKNNFYTIKFSKMIKKINKQIKNHKSDLNKLNKLRNQESHFYLCRNSFLKFDDFKRLHLLMKDYFDFCEKNMLLGYFGSAPSKDDLFYFSYKEIVENKYEDLVVNSPTNKKIIESFNMPNNDDVDCGATVAYVNNDLYRICKEYYDDEDNQLKDICDINIKMNFIDFYYRMKNMIDVGLIEISCDTEIMEDEYDVEHEYPTVNYFKKRVH